MRVLFIISLILSCFAGPAQILFNGNFEALTNTARPEGWDLTFGGQNTYDVKLDSLVKMQGKYSISSGKSQASYGAINFPIHRRYEGKTIMLVGTIKTENVTGWAGIWVRIDGANGQVLGFDNMEKTGITGTTPWKEYMIQVPYDGDEAVTINVGGLLAGKGKMWLDSVRLYVDDLPIDQAALKTSPGYRALKDTAFSTSSGVPTIVVDNRSSKYLTLLGELWGFLKYHHPAIAKGDYNWDAELFRILPAVLNCPTDERFSAVMEDWVDKLGKPALCTDCMPLSQMKDVALMPDYGDLFTNAVLSASLIGKLTYLRDNSNNAKNFYVEVGGMNPVFKHELAYSKKAYPDAGYRLLALYRYWNVIQYFSPNRKLIPEGWEQVLGRFIPLVIHAKDSTDYIDAMVKLIVTTHDTHSFLSSAVWEKHIGNFRVPFQAKFIEDKLVVTGYYKDTLQVKDNFKTGDVIVSINGLSVRQLVKKYLLLVPASNKEVVLRDMPGMYLLRSKNALFTFKLIRGKKTFLINQQAAPLATMDFYGYDFHPDAGSPGYSLINKDIGYVFAGRYKNADLDSMKKRFEKTKGIIIDMRCYPSDEMHATLGSFFKPGSSDFIKFTQASVQHPGLFIYIPGEKTGNGTTDYYKGKVVVIVNSMTQSNAEFVTMAFQSAPNVVVIGSTTSGADGNISEIALPGISTYLSGLGVYYPDGVNAQRAGVKIDYRIKPTIRGVIDGRDEVLEKGEEIIMREGR